MKRGWKIFWIVCASFTVLGVVLSIVGVFLGATVANLRIAANADGGGVERQDAYDWNEDDFDEYDFDDHDFDAHDRNETDNGFQADYQVQELDVDVSFMGVIVKEYDGDRVRVDTSRLADELRGEISVRQEEEELTVSLNNKSAWSRVFSEGDSGVLLIEIPSGGISEAALKIGGGSLSVKDIKVRDLEIEVGAGEAKIEQFTAQSLELLCEAGKVNISGTADSKIQIECGVGEVTYHAPGKKEDYNYELECGIGKLSVGNESFSGIGKDRDIYNGSDVIMEIECGIGKVDIVFDQAK